MADMSKRITAAAALFAVLYCARRYYRNWGATKAECQMVLPGDTSVGDPVTQTTEAVSIDAPPSVVWARLMKICQGGGDKDRVHTDLRPPEVGDVIHLTTEGWLGPSQGLTFSIVDIAPEKYVVLSAVKAESRRNAVLSLHVQPHWEDRVRLLARARFGLRYPGEVLVMELFRPLIALGTRAWLRSVKQRAERPVPAEPILTVAKMPFRQQHRRF